MIRVAFFGTPEAAVPSLRALLADESIDVVAAVTNPDRPSGRGYKLRPPPVKVAAREAGLPVWQPEKPREIVTQLRAAELDVCAIVAYGALLPPDVLAAGGRGFVNLHFSLLPRHRGAAPVAHALLNGDEETGVTCFLLNEGMDTGDVLTTWRTRIRPGETAGELTRRLAEEGAPALVEALKGLVTGTLPLRPQEHGRATYAPKIAPEDARIDWTRPAESVALAVRAFEPVPGAHTTFAGARLKVHRAKVVDGSGPAGVVVRVDADTRPDGSDAGGPVVACGTGALRLDVVQPAGKPRMGGLDFANGYRPEGQRLGTAGYGG